MDLAAFVPMRMTVFKTIYLGTALIATSGWVGLLYLGLTQFFGM